VIDAINVSHTVPDVRAMRRRSLGHDVRTRATLLIRATYAAADVDAVLLLLLMMRRLLPRLHDSAAAATALYCQRSLMFECYHHLRRSVIACRIQPTETNMAHAEDLFIFLLSAYSLRN